MIEPFEGINKMPPWKKEEYASALKEAKDLNNETVKIKSAQQLPKKTKIKCPGCGVTYEVTKMETYTIRCMDCGAEYLQAIHNVDNPEFIRAAAYRCRG